VSGRTALAVAAFGVVCGFLVGTTPAQSNGTRPSADSTLQHTVEEGETLWSIAAQTDIYADPYLWPLIYKFNRDQIVDPARIYPAQTLLIPIGLSADARDEARRAAGAPIDALP
jgi:nucleoid-associated protein YgaU